uniref:DNA-directed RNA polymerase subunit alpha n=1 Tax=Adenocalymma aurantiacum TaxID=2056445 RepID=A0A2H4REF3_9LAMI|nr:RNA polymerase alpha subunit [Adenocalymma aurantiacum]ATY47910.1 RNA polymerase alpha subunit [Adenocalymma aurantiacum]
MIRDKVTVSTQTLQWECVESRTDSKLLHYGRFVLAPFMKDQADTIGIALRRALIEEVEGTCITCVKFKNVPFGCYDIPGVQESVHDIVTNLKRIVLRSNTYGTSRAFICVKGPGYVTAQDIILPPYVEIVDNTQHIATLTEPIDLRIRLEIERSSGYLRTMPSTRQDRCYPIHALFMPVRNTNHSIHSYKNGKKNQEILFLEIWTNGSLTPKEALHEASRKLIDLLIPFLHKEEENLALEDNQHTVPLSPFTFHDKWDILSDKWDKLRKKKKLRKNKQKIALKSIFIDQFKMSPRVYNCLKKSNIYTLFDLLNKSQEDLMKIENFRREDTKEILGIIEQYFAIFLPKKKF